ncbi:MAG TPA: flagellar hook basal-body protein [Tepidisphaeraceae bacterium]|jgi:flagellar basal body rod protein FlgG
MIYGLYLSATGVLTNSHRQDVIANNLANAQTVGFKRNLALLQQRATEAQSSGEFDKSDPMLESIGGGLLLAPTSVDRTEGALEMTHSNLDVAIHGSGYFTVQDGNQTMLTRNGQFMTDRDGTLMLADGSGHQVLNADGKQIQLKDVPESQVNIDKDGTISANGQIVDRLGLVDVPNETLLTQRGGTLLSYPNMKDLAPASGTLQSGFVEQSNVDPTIELTQLIDAQRQLEANANMIRMQDQTLAEAVTDLGKIS